MATARTYPNRRRPDPAAERTNYIGVIYFAQEDPDDSHWVTLKSTQPILEFPLGAAEVDSGASVQVVQVDSLTWRARFANVVGSGMAFYGNNTLNLVFVPGVTGVSTNLQVLPFV